MTGLLLLWAYFPPPAQTAELLLDNAPWKEAQPWQALRVRLSSPIRLRSGEAGTVRLSIQPDETAQAAPFSPVLLVTRLDLPGLVVEPAGDITMLLSTPDALMLEWKVRASKPDDFGGTAWLYVEHSAQDEPVERLPVLAQEFKIRVTGWSWAPLLAAVGGMSLLWLALFFQRKRVQSPSRL